jgi:hypothetical protein
MYAVFCFISCIVTIVGIIIAWCNHGTECFNYTAGLWMLTVGSIVFVFSGIQSIRNEFACLLSEAKEKEANIKVLQAQYKDLQSKLETFVEKYFSHESSIIEAVKGRNLQNMNALLEAYPELKALGGTSKLIDSICDLRKQISDAQQQFNRVARNYNAYAMQAPYSMLMPSTYEKQLPYLSE